MQGCDGFKHIPKINKGSKIKKWAIKDKSGNWWLVNGSEFPEKNAKKEQEIKKDEAPDFVFYFLSW